MHWDFIVYAAEVFFYENKQTNKYISNLPKGEERREISSVDVHSLLEPLIAWRSCSS